MRLKQLDNWLEVLRFIAPREGNPRTSLDMPRRGFDPRFSLTRTNLNRAFVTNKEARDCAPNMQTATAHAWPNMRANLPGDRVAICGPRHKRPGPWATTIVEVDRSKIAANNEPGRPTWAALFRSRAGFGERHPSIAGEFWLIAVDRLWAR